MKKNVSTTFLPIASLAILFFLFSSFIINSSAVGETVKNLNQATEHKHNFLKTTALTLGALGGAALMRRRFKRHYHRHMGGGVGCLGVIGIIGLVIVGLVLLPLILVALVVAGILAIFGVRFRRPRRRHRRFD